VRRHAAYLGLSFVLLALDQLSKFLVQSGIALYENVVVIPGFFSLTHIHNRGAIFGIMSRNPSRLTTILLPVLSLVALSLVVYYFIKTPPSEKFMKISLTLILAGAVGNQIDRLVRGYVIDFLDVYVKNWHWPTFNVADSCISIGAVLLILTFIFRRD
jgi:signal peptidase II